MSSASPSTEATPNPRVRSRSRAGCTTCKVRKVKCDQERPTCTPCQRRKVQCQWVENLSEFESIERKRSGLACNACRSRKVKCIRDEGEGSTCNRCEKLSLQCDWSVDSPNGRAGEGASSFPRNSQTGARIQAALGDKTQIMELAKRYFATVHYYNFYTFIHPAHYFRLLNHDRIPRELSLIISASAIRFGTDDVDRKALDMADSWCDEVCGILLPQLHRNFGAIQLMALMLAQQYESARGNHVSAWILVGNAVKMMQMLRLNTLDVTYPSFPEHRLSPLCRAEALRRLAWGVYILDTISDGGKFGAHTITYESLEIQLPADETAFIRDNRTITAPLIPRTTYEDEVKTLGEQSMSAHLVRTCFMRRRILHFAARVKQSPRTPAELQADVTKLETDLNSLVASLPQSLAYGETQYFAMPDKVGMLVHLHCLRHNCYIILNRARILVAGLDLSLTSEVASYRRQRVERALPIAKIIGDALRHGINLDPAIGIQAYVALEILLFEPLRLAQEDRTVQTRTPASTRAITTLLNLIRKLASINASVSSMYSEACYRLVVLGFSDVLRPEDVAAGRAGNPLVGQDPAEYDFRDMREQRYEQHRRRGQTDVSATDAWVDLGNGTATAIPSTLASPQIGPVDAGDMVPSTNSNLPTLLAGSQTTNLDELLSYANTTSQVPAAPLDGSLVNDVQNPFDAPSTSPFGDLDFGQWFTGLSAPDHGLRESDDLWRDLGFAYGGPGDQS